MLVKVKFCYGFIFMLDLLLPIGVETNMVSKAKSVSPFVICYHCFWPIFTFYLLVLSLYFLPHCQLVLVISILWCKRLMSDAILHWLNCWVCCGLSFFTHCQFPIGIGWMLNWNINKLCIEASKMKRGQVLCFVLCVFPFWN